MTLTKGVDTKIVDYLLSAERDVREITKITDQYPELSIEEAYELQERLINRKIAEGARTVGIKLGLTSKVKQQMMGVHEAIYGFLLNEMLAYEWEPVDFHQLIHPKAEPEIAFLMGEDLKGDNVTTEEVLNATKYIAPAIEIIDSRYKNFKFTLTDVVADNCSSARFIVGSKWVTPNQTDLANIGMVMSKNGEVATVGAGAAVLGHPASAVAWAINKLTEKGKGLKKGDIVLSGAITEAIAFESGDTIVAQFDGLGSVSFSCS
ncbi:2-keto-4-pentenoate hydratase [Pseudalkalibacillus sp. A8]|uniref:2-keto-4-pentenoate hydratase n=1 Tax=Pseudalkalibacillus sp. A8 TaxID=3382641 RepID=UPI0038B60091